MISQTLPALFSSRFSLSPDSNSQLKERHFHPHDVSQRQLKPVPIAQGDGGQVGGVDPQSRDRVSLQSPLVSPNSSSLQVRDVSASMRRSFEIQMTTQQGDVVTIAYNEASTDHQNAFEFKDAENSVKGFQTESSNSSEFQISIKGDLNEDEQKSLQDLMQQMQKVGKDFFQGDTKSAFQQAQKMGFDTEQIAGFSMSLNMEKSVRAVSAYQEISEQQPIDNKVLKQAGDFYNQASQAMSGRSDVLQLFAEPAKVFNDLAQGIVETIAGQFEGLPDVAQHIDTLKKLLGLVGGSVPGEVPANVNNQDPKSVESPSIIEV